MSTHPFDPLHPAALAVYCSDGRFTRAVEELLSELGYERLDTMTLPGGPALLTHFPADLSEVHVFTRAAHFLIDAHAIKHVVLVAHEGCGFYKARCGRLADDAIKVLQVRHLREAAVVLRRQRPELEVGCFYAGVSGHEVTFTDVGG
jgi:hypothetical protein